MPAGLWICIYQFDINQTRCTSSPKTSEAAALKKSLSNSFDSTNCLSNSHNLCCPSAELIIGNGFATTLTGEWQGESNAWAGRVSSSAILSYFLERKRKGYKDENLKLRQMWNIKWSLENNFVCVLGEKVHPAHLKPNFLPTRTQPKPLRSARGLT